MSDSLEFVRGDALERAFAIARTGTCLSLEQLKLRLKEDGFDDLQVGPHLAKLLAEVIADHSPFRQA